MGIIQSFLSWFSRGATRRAKGVQTREPGSGKLTTRPVNDETAMQISAVFGCCRVLAETVASLPLRFYERKDGDKKGAPITMHPLLDLMNFQPNQYQTRVEFWETYIWQLALHGNTYSRIDRNPSGNIISLLPYMTPQTQPVLRDDGRLIYEYNDGSKFFRLDRDDMWHGKLFGNGVLGISPLAYGANTIGIAISADDRVSRMANNGFKPSGILKLNKVLTPEQRLTIRENYAGMVEGGEDELRILEANMDFIQTTMNPKDVQLLETRRFQLEDICRFFNVPSVLVNDTSGTTVWGSGIQQIIQGFYKFGLRPYTERTEASIERWLLPVEERRKILVEFDIEELLEGDRKTRYEAHATGIKGGFITPNEARVADGREPIPGGDTLVDVNKASSLQLNQGGK